jgi:hypothetical protein
VALTTILGSSDQGPKQPTPASSAGKAGQRVMGRRRPDLRRRARGTMVRVRSRGGGAGWAQGGVGGLGAATAGSGWSYGLGVAQARSAMAGRGELWHRRPQTRGASDGHCKRSSSELGTTREVEAGKVWPAAGAGNA